ncbi:MAG: hypothetical protein P8X96_25700 [Desulfobacteraceae bacterium]
MPFKNISIVNIRAIILLILSSSVLFGCAATPPKQQISDSSAAAIRVGVKLHYSFISAEFFAPDVVFLVKLKNKGDSLKQKILISTNYRYESLAANLLPDSIDCFLLDIEPGIYAAIGALGKGRNSQADILVFFPEEMVRKTITLVESNKMYFMGRYILKYGSSVNGFQKPDELQAYYYKLLRSGNEELYTKTRISHYQSPVFAFPVLKFVDNSTDDEIKFLKKRLNLFKNTSRESTILNRITLLERMH